MTSTRELVSDRREEYAFHDDIVYLAETKRGLTRDTVAEISRFKDEPEWMLQFRLRAYDHFVKRPMPSWGGYLGTGEFWGSTLENWQSEFLAVGSFSVFAIYLRQRGSSQSKPVGASHDATGVEG